MFRYIRKFGIHALLHPRIAVMGFREGWHDMGMTYGDPTTSRSIAYDFGRTMRRLDM